jgi:hypothetical protein
MVNQPRIPKLTPKPWQPLNALIAAAEAVSISG